MSSLFKIVQGAANPGMSFHGNLMLLWKICLLQVGPIACMAIADMKAFSFSICSFSICSFSICSFSICSFSICRISLNGRHCKAAVLKGNDAMCCPVKPLSLPLRVNGFPTAGLTTCVAHKQ